METCCDIVLFMNTDRIDFSRPKKRETAPRAVPIAKLKAIGAFFVCTVHVPFIIPGRQTRLMRTRWLHYSAPSSCSASAPPPSPQVRGKPTHVGNQMQINSINTLFPPLIFCSPEGSGTAKEKQPARDRIRETTVCGGSSSSSGQGR